MPGNHVLLETIELTQSAATVTFDNLPSSGYTDLKIVASSRCTDTTSNKWVAGYLNFNGVSSNLSSINIAARLTSVVPFSDANIAYCFWLSGSDTTSSTFGTAEITIPNYLSTSQNKSYSSDWGEGNDSTTLQIMGVSGGKWASNSAITSVTLIPQAGSIASGSTFSLYGVAALGTTPTSAPRATGGNIVATDGSYWYHAFLTSGTFTPQTNLTCEYLVVGGGGGASRYGGGGAGGYRTSSGSLTASNYSVTIGAGGATNHANQQGNNGTSSIFSSTTSSGGGAGGAVGATVGPGLAGASGGGGGSDGPYPGGAGNTPSTSPSQGNSGGSGAASHPLYAGGGGGGAGASGGNASGSVGGNGGIGSNAHSTWASVTGTGVSGYYAGGGGGTGYNYPGLGTGGSGGAGGGGAGRSIGDGSQIPVPGMANTGGGGGGGWSSSSLGSNAGGSGIVIIRYAVL